MDHASGPISTAAVADDGRMMERNPLHAGRALVARALRPLRDVGGLSARRTPRNLPMPPHEMRLKVSPILDDSYYDNPNGEYVWGALDIPPLKRHGAYRKVLDFGCGCGREARRLLLQKRPPAEYVGVDVHAGMIDWCQQNLQSERFRFYHLDAWSPSYGIDNTPANRVQPIAHLGSDFSIIEANSVFTHLLADQSEYYLDQMRSMIAPRGIIRGTWFFVNKRLFPPMGENFNTLFVNDHDPTYAVYYDWEYFRATIKRLGYRLIKIDWSPQTGFHNMVYLASSHDFADLTDSATPPGTAVIGF